MDRRQLLIAAGVQGLLGGLLAGSPAFARAADTAPDMKTTARAAWLYALPLVEMATARARMLKGVQEMGAQGARLNGFAHARHLVTPAGRTITTPNVDTVYSSAWMDLTKGPLKLTVPATGERYWSIAFMDMNTNNNAVLGLRTVGGAGGEFTIVGPGQAGSGPNVVRMATPHGWALIRLLIDGDADMAAAHALQDQFVMTGPGGMSYPAYATREDTAERYFQTARALLAADPAPATDTRLLRRFSALLGPGAAPALAPEVAAGVEQAKAIAKFATGRQQFVQGWTYPRPNLGDYGQDYLYRGIVALVGLGALPPQEAMYMKSAGDDGAGLMTGDGLYRLTLPGKIPTDAFWSLTMYEATPDGQYFLTGNELSRYAIGDRTPGLKWNADGSLDLWIGRSNPGGDKASNWLPAPKAGPFSVTLRTYLPRAELLDGRYRLPPITKM
ncbi:MAG: hypothetical protein JWP35_2189 [Caulobacter sp.]|nr:hypothetical protein [Caulobacter sp.]